MSHPAGKYLGGIRTLQHLQDRCRICATTGCWRWSLSTDNGAPKVHVTLAAGHRVIMRGRRAALVLQRGAMLPAGHVAYATDDCRHADCCNPRHCQSGTDAEQRAWLAASGRLKGSPTRAAASRRTWDKRGRKLTPEMVQHIRTSPLSTYALATELGVAQYTVWSARTQLSHRTSMRGTSVFNQVLP